MLEVLEEHVSPADLGKKYGISPHAIRDWIKKAGHRLPKSYRRRNTPYTMKASGIIGYKMIDYSKTSSGSICFPCDRKFVNERDLENHMNAKHHA